MLFSKAQTRSEAARRDPVPVFARISTVQISNDDAVVALAGENPQITGPAGPGSDSNSAAFAPTISSPSAGPSLTHRSRLVTGGARKKSARGFGGRQAVEGEGHRRAALNGEKVSKKAGYSRRDLSILTLSALGFLVGMGFLVFGVLVMLGFFPFEHVVPQSASAAPAEGRQVTYGSVIKLMHDRTKYRLHSHDVPYGTGSGQQSVTGFPGVDDSNSYWVVKPIAGSKFRQGEPIYSGATVRLLHSQTKKWLHSHLHPSPISNNLEVSAFGSPTQSDTGDHWRLIIEGKGNTWLRDQKIRLLHVDTGGYLHTHEKKYSRIVAGQQEVCGVMKKSSDNVWMAAEGVYFPTHRNDDEGNI